jgi:hypothetical protein
LDRGWQFGSDGECLHIPQLAADAKIPLNACVKSFPGNAKVSFGCGQVLLKQPSAIAFQL